MVSQAPSTPPPKDPSFEDRLRAARRRQGMDPTPRDDAARQASAMAVGLRVGVELVSALVVAVGIGLGLDYWLGTKPWFLVLFVPIGGAAGVMNIWRLLGPAKQKSAASDGRTES